MHDRAVRRHPALVASLVAATLLLLGALGTLAGPFVTGALVQVSGTSPFAGCTADDVAGQIARDPTGQRKVYLNSEVEPWVDVNPTNPNNIVAFWQQDRWSDGGSRGLVAGVSLNGGVSWTSVVIPGISQCSGGSLPRATDPWLSFAPDGTVHQISLALDIDPPANRPGGNGRNALLVSRSTNGGLTWTAPITLIEDENPRFLNDKQSITADPTDPHLVYAVTDPTALANGASTRMLRVTLTLTGHRSLRESGVAVSGALEPSTGNLYGVWQDSRFIGFRFDEVAFSMSTDGGLTWSTPIKVSQTPVDTTNPLRAQAFLPSVAVTADGTIVVTYYDFRNDGSSGELADYFAVHCHAACGSRSSWGNEVRLTDTSFDILNAPVARGFFLGDYMGLAASGHDTLAVFTQPHGADASSVFFRRTGP